jgi:drug/metabolite transporter (DMT)-like permease
VAVTVAGLALLAVARARGQSLRIPREYWPTIVVATCFYLVLWNIASTYAAILIPSGQASVLGFTMPLWSALISWAVLGERLGGRMLLGLLFGGAAVGLLMVPGLRDYANAPLGFALGLLAGLGWAVGSLILKRGQVLVPATVLTGWQLLITALPTTAGAFLFGDGQWFMPSWQTIIVVAYIALIPMSVGNVAWFSIVGMLPVNVAGLSSIMVPMVAMVSGALVHGEPLGPVQWAAMLCCAVSLSLVLLKPAAAR